MRAGQGLKGTGGPRKSRLPPQYICYFFTLFSNLSYFQGFLYFSSPMSSNKNGVACVKHGVAGRVQ